MNTLTRVTERALAGDFQEDTAEVRRMIGVLSKDLWDRDTLRGLINLLLKRGHWMWDLLRVELWVPNQIYMN